MADPSGIISLTAGASALAWKLYKQCRDSPGQYKDLSDSTKQLYNILHEIDDLMQDEAHVGLNRSDFAGSIQSCNVLLIDLRARLDKHKSLGTNQRRLPDRVKWDEQEVKRLHARISQNVQMLSMSLQRYNASTQVRIVRLLNDILEQLRSGQRRPESVSSFAAARNGHEAEAWPNIVQELGDLGLPEDDANDNRGFILSILQEAELSDLDSDAESMPGDPQLIVEDTTPQQPSHEFAVSSLRQTRDHDTGARSTHSPAARRVSRQSSGMAHYAVSPLSETAPSTAPGQDVFSEGHESVSHHSQTSYDAMSLRSLSALQLQSSSASNRKFLSIFDPVAAEIEVEVRRQPNTLRDDLNLAKRYWSSRDWANCKRRLLRLLVASELPHHRRPDLTPRLTAFLLGVACTYSGDLESARLVFTALLSDSYPAASRSVSPSNNTGGAFPEHTLDDSGIAAAMWLGDICLMTNRSSDGAYAHAIALDSLRRKAQLSPLRPSSVASSRSDVPAVQSLNRSALQRRSTSQCQAVKPVLEQILVCELDVVNSRTQHLDEVFEALCADDFPRSGSMFEDVRLPVSPLAIIQQAQAPMGGLSSATYPLLRDFKATFTNKQDSERRLIARDRSEILKGSNESLVAIQDRLTLQTSKAGWPLMWNPYLSMCAPVYATEWFHDATPVPEEGFLSDVKALSQVSGRDFKPEYLIPKDDPSSFAARLRRWLTAVHIDYKEFPTEIRCRPQSDRSNKWPEIAVFSISASMTKPEGLFKRTKMGASVTAIMHWNGSFIDRANDASSSSVATLVEAFATHFQSSEVQMKKETRQRDNGNYQRRMTMAQAGVAL